MTDDLQHEIGTRIRQRRMELKWSGDQLASQSGVDVATISRTENGVSQVTLDSAVRICRSLGITLSDLVDNPESQVPSALTQTKHQDPIEGNDALLQQCVQALLTLFQQSESSAKELLVHWANRISAELSSKGISTRDFTVEDRDIEIILSKDVAFRFKVRYPEASRIWVIETVHRLGGELNRGDLPLLFSAISEDPDRYRLLDQKDRELLRRLPSGTPDRVRLLDVVRIQERLGFDLVSMYDNVERLTRFAVPEVEARVISLFVALCSWLRSLSTGDSQWLATVHRDIELKQQEVEQSPRIFDRS